MEVTETSGVFKPRAIDAVNGADLLVMWLEHLLVLSMLQHPSQTWNWGRFVLVHPAGNTDVAEACNRYRDLLADQSTFSSMTVEELLGADVLPARRTTALRKRYIPADAGALLSFSGLCIWWVRRPSVLKRSRPGREVDAVKQ